MSMTRKVPAAALEVDDHAALVADLGRLNEVAPGIGDRAVRYVEAGTDTSVLLEIKALGASAMTPFQRRYGEGYEEHQARRRRALVDVQQWRPAMVHRFAIVLDTLREAAGWLPYRTGDDRSPRWLLGLIQEVNTVTHSGYERISDPSVLRFYSVAPLLDVLQAAGEPEVTLLYHLYGPKDYARDRLSLYTEGLDTFLVSKSDIVSAALPGLHADGRERLINDIGRLKIAETFFDVLFAVGTGPSKGTRRAVRAILKDVPADRLVAKGQETLASGNTEQRRETIELLASLAGTSARDALAAHLKNEKSKGVQDVIAAALDRIDAAPSTAPGSAGDNEGRIRAIDGAWIESPPLPPLPPDTPLPAEALDRIRALIPDFNAATAKRDAEHEALYRERGWNGFRPQPPIDENEAIDDFLTLVNGRGNGRNAFYDMMGGGEGGPGVIRRAVRALRLH